MDIYVCDCQVLFSDASVTFRGVSVCALGKLWGHHVTVVAVFVGTFFVFFKCCVFQCPLRRSVWFYAVYEKKGKIVAVLN